MEVKRRINRGDIFYVYKTYDIAAEERKGTGSPAVVVSSNKINSEENSVEVVYINKKNFDRETSVEISYQSGEHYACCERVNSVSVLRLGYCVSKCTQEDIQKIDKALSLSLSLQYQPNNNTANNLCDKEKYERLVVERNLYKRMYDELIGKLISNNLT